MAPRDQHKNAHVIDYTRLGYVVWVATWLGVIFPNMTAEWCTPKNRSTSLQFFGAAEEDLYAQWLLVLSYALDCADEARSLMQKLQLP